MTDPMEQFKTVFFEECSELLVSLEEGLMELQGGDTDPETMNAIFRSVHSIKGGAGAFNFDELVAFAHIQETLLDEMRSGEIAIEPDYVAVLLRAFDILSELVGAAQSGETLDKNYGSDVANEMKKIMESGGDSPAENPEDKSEDSMAQADEEHEASEQNVATQHRYLIKFKPFPDLFQSANEPLLLIRELAALGNLDVDVDTGDLPDLEDLEPGKAYFSWTFYLTTEDNLEAIEEVFEFVEGDCELEIRDLGIHLSGDDFVEDDTAGLFGDEPEDIAENNKAETAEETASEEKTQTSEPENKAKTLEKPVKKAKPATVVTQSIRVELEKVDRLVNMVGELVITQAMLREQGSHLLVDQYPHLVQGIEELSRHTRDLQDSVMAIRAQPVKSVFSRMPRLVRELTASLGKKARLIMSGEETEVDKTVTERIGDPLTHMIRNSADHGLESPEERLAAGKPEEGTIHLSAFHRGGRIFIEVKDDGAGINREVVERKAIEKGLIAPDSNLCDEEIDNLIFMPGFSTAESVTNVSGRGVGMDVVRKNIQSLGGRISVTSNPGKGTKFSLSLPLTLAVMDGMVIEIGPEKYVLPLANIIQTLRPVDEEVNNLPNGTSVLMFRGEYIPIVPLYQVFDIKEAIHNPCEGLVVVVEGDGGILIGLMVDELVNQQQVVIKSLESNYEQIEGVSGATILGNGHVSLIIDIASIQEMDGYFNGMDQKNRPIGRFNNKDVPTHPSQNSEVH